MVDVPSITFDEAELRESTPRETTVAHATELFRKAGALRLNSVFSPATHGELDVHYRKRYGSELIGTTKADRRPLFTVDVEGPFGQPSFYANPFILPIIERLLGNDCILGALSSVVSFPGAPAQFTHRDSPSLFGDYAYDVNLPPYALTVLIPLIDANEETGSTEVWPKSHLDPNLERVTATPPVHPLVPKGSVMMTDSRVVHRGAANRSELVRPLVYMSFHRHWFRDYSGYEDRPPIAISPLSFNAVAEQHRRLFSWRFDPYLKMRVKRQAQRVAREIVPAPLLDPLKAAWKRVGSGG